jgi:hypothetical protein
MIQQMQGRVLRKEGEYFLVEKLNLSSKNLDLLDRVAKDEVK